MRPRSLDEVRLQERRFETAVATVKITEDDQLERIARPLHVNESVEEPRADRKLLDVLDSDETVGTGRALAIPLQHRLLDQVVVPVDLRFQLHRMRRVRLLEWIEQR